MCDGKMQGLIVFNSSNDVVYFKLNIALRNKINEVAISQGLIDSGSFVTSALDSNVILQIFSPLISSQRIMHCQFDNAYSSLQCENGLNIAFGDFLGHTFLKIGQNSLQSLERSLGVTIALARFLYGANLFSPLVGATQDELLNECLSCFEGLLLEDAAILVEALPRMHINSELNRTVNAALEAALDQLRQYEQERSHVMIFIANKYVSMRSGKQAQQLSPSDLISLYVLTRTLQGADSSAMMNRFVAIFAQGNSNNPHSGCMPCIVHVSHISGMTFVQVVEYANLQLASCLYDTFFVLHKIVSLQSQGDMDLLKPAYEGLESFIRQLIDISRKHIKQRGDEINGHLKKFIAKWENVRKLYGEFFKALDREVLMRIDSNLSPFIEDLRQLFAVACYDSSTVQLDLLPAVASLVEAKLLEFSEFLAVKAERNISIEAYLEDFPGLVHFIYVNRTNGLMIVPDLRGNSIASKPKLRSMVEFSRKALRRGQTRLTWKDKTFLYSYFLWFEDSSTGALKSVDLQQYFAANAIGSNSLKAHFEPGALAMDYYQYLVEVCFPKAIGGSIRCYELFCMHLGLVTPTCAAEHSRRLVATISDIADDTPY